MIPLQSYHHVSQLTLCGLQPRWRRQLLRCYTEAVAVAEEQDPLLFSLSAFARFDPLAHPSAVPHALQEANRSALDVRSVVLAHDRLDRFRRFIGVVKWDRRHEVVEYMGLNDAVQQLPADEAELPVNRRCRSASEVP